MSMLDALESEEKTVEEITSSVHVLHEERVILNYFAFEVSGDMIAVFRRGSKKKGVTVRRRCAQLRELGEQE